jgi:hypothetical protein
MLPGFRIEDVTDIIIPGRDLTSDGNDIELGTRMRAWAAGNFLAKFKLASRGGLIVCSANRSPRAAPGEPWLDADTGVTFENGIPEAEGMRRALAGMEYVPTSNVIKQQLSFETAGDIRRGEDRLLEEFERRGINPAGRLVLIAAQRVHLGRIINSIAPHTMRLPHIGGLVPEADLSRPDSYPLASTLASRYIVHGLRPMDLETADIIDQRARKAFKIVMAAETFFQTIKHGGRDGRQVGHAA